MSRRTLILGTAGIIYFVALTLIGMWPTPVDHSFSSTIFDVTVWLRRQGAPQWISYNFIEFIANVLLFIPLGLLGDAWLRHRRPWRIVAFGVCLSIAIEIAQWLARPERFATLADVIANTLGAALGVIIAQLFRLLRR
ncbi:hypothetical protein BH09ACT10_BH09ACT10_23840 [soil metagenome]